MADLKNLKGISEKDRAELEQAESLLGAEPESMGFVKNLFWGRVREREILPYPDPVSPEEKARCDQLLAELETYLRDEHPAVQIDQEQEVPQWVLDRLFKMGVLGMTIPTEYGGLGMGITSYNRVLEMLGKYCGSTAVIVSAHLSIGCGAIKLFGTEEQKRQWLPKLAREWLSAFCLSEPNVGCDAGGQETRCELSEDGEHYIINGEKKWATSGALSSLFTVMAKQKLGDGKEKVTALVCTPDMEGVDIFQKNRSKCGIRGTWQARIRFENVRVPKSHLLHKEGKGLNVALTCLNFGRCTLSAGMLGGARRAMDQAVAWSRTRYQFERPLSDFELMRKRIAHMAALNYAMDAVLYATTGFLDRGDEDIMVETAICKMFCSEMGWEVVNDAVQIMGGEGYMTENEVERIFRDSRINLIVEGANEVMQRFIFGYGGKQLAEHMLGVRDAVGWNRDEGPVANVKRITAGLRRPAIRNAAIPLALEVFLKIRPRASRIGSVHRSLRPQARRLARLARELSFQFKQASQMHEEKILERQCVQARIGDAAMYVHAFACTLSRLDQQIRAGVNGPEGERDRAAAMHFFDLAEQQIEQRFGELYRNPDESMREAAAAALEHNQTLPPELFILPERTPTDLRGKGRPPVQAGVKQFPGGSVMREAAAAEH